MSPLRIEGPLDLQALWTSTRDHYNGLWTLYAAVAFGFVGFAFTETYRKTSRRARQVLTVVFALFVATNVKSSLDNVHLQRETLRLIEAGDTSQASLVALLAPPSDALVLLMHLLAAAAVLFALWISPRSARPS